MSMIDKPPCNINPPFAIRLVACNDTFLSLVAGANQLEIAPLEQPTSRTGALLVSVCRPRDWTDLRWLSFVRKRVS